MEYLTKVAIVWSKCISEVLFQLGLTVPTAKDSTKTAAEMVNAMPDVRQGLQWLARELVLVVISAATGTVRISEVSITDSIGIIQMQ